MKLNDALAGTLLGILVDKRWLILPAVVTTVLAKPAIQGWYPPIDPFRTIGIRTRPEIDRERYTLKRFAAVSKMFKTRVARGLR